MDICENQNNGNQNNEKVIEELKNDKIKLQSHLKVTRENNGALKQTIEILEKKNKKSEIKANELEENLKELKTNQSKLVSELESCRSTDADLVISQRELNECNQDLEAEVVRNSWCEYGKTTCAHQLGYQGEINRQLQARNSELAKSLKNCDDN